MNQTILSHFRFSDPILYDVILRHENELGSYKKQNAENYMKELCESIVSQQLSVKAAKTIWSRSLLYIKDWNDPHEIINTPELTFREFGLSRQKISYIRNIAQANADGHLHTLKFDRMTDTEIITELTKIKGIGQWTAEMFLIFTLGRPDVFSAGDLGLRNAICWLYQLKSISPVQATELSVRWAPYRSYASRALWLSLDAKPS